MGDGDEMVQPDEVAEVEAPPEREYLGGEVVDEDGEVVADAPQVESVVVSTEEVDVEAALDEAVADGAETVKPTAAVRTPNAADEFEMFHPGTPGADTATTTREAFDAVWQYKGWREVVGRRADGRLVLAAAKVDPEGYDDDSDDVGGSTGSPDETSDAVTGAESDSETSPEPWPSTRKRGR